MLNNFNPEPYDNDGYVFIAGTPRSATQYIAHCYQAIGIDIKHEKFGSKGISAFQIAPYLASIKKGIVLHQTRDTLQTISSMQTINKAWPYLRAYTGIHPDNDGNIKANKYKPLSWTELEFVDGELCKYVVEMGHRYGY